MSIINLLNQIKQGEIVLPAIQRDFVWDEGRICMLLDSIMRGYPIGIVLLWETYQAIQYRKFETFFIGEKRYKFSDNASKRRCKVVLDGQQRLQSLYVALYGKNKGKSLFFDVLSGHDVDDFREEKFTFKFGKPSEAEEWNKKAAVQYAMNTDGTENGNTPHHYVKVDSIFSMAVKDRQIFRRDLVKKLELNQNDDLRVETNLARFDEAMTRDENILLASVIDENKISDSSERQSEADVLEIFVRINRQGMPLSRSDLIFSMLKLNWKESAEALWNAPLQLDKMC